MNSNSNRIRVVAMLAAASMLTLLLVACGDGGPLDVRAAEPSKESSPSGVLDPALDRLEGVTHHG
jgi:predicted small lipoprotein YifL